RLCGLPGDKVQLVNGILFVNDRNADSGLNLKEQYVLAPHELDKLGSDYALNHPEEIGPGPYDSILIMLESDVFRKKSLKGRLVVDDDPSMLASIYSHPWTRDIFGLLTIPAGYFFALGDNRHGAADSRYAGLIPVKSYISTVISKK